MSSGRGAGEEVLQVRGGDLGPAGDGAAGVQVCGEVAQDAQPGLEGDVAEGALPGAAAAVLLADLGVVELGDGVTQRSGNGGDVPLAGGPPPAGAVCRVPARARGR